MAFGCEEMGSSVGPQIDDEAAAALGREVTLPPRPPLPALGALVDELERLSLPFNDQQVPSEAELRIAQAQLVGWLEGLFHGIQATLFAQQMAARQQLENMRGELPPGAGRPGSGMPEPEDRPGTYL